MIKHAQLLYLRHIFGLSLAKVRYYKIQDMRNMLNDK